ncbi:MAG: hypothetical protein JJ863_24180 [Deltaproteobacteria bacterium]|nr:hypothetical protein [Deltaproteobacteria bacterium]
MKVEPVTLNNDLMEVITETPCAPGTPITLELGELRLQAKSRGTKKRDDGRFDLKVRLVGLRREERERLVALMG